MTRSSPTIDAARIELMLTELRLPAMKAMWPEIAAQSDKEGWTASRFLAALAEQEMADRSRRRIACQSARKFDPGSASNFDPGWRAGSSG